MRLSLGFDLFKREKLFVDLGVGLEKFAPADYYGGTQLVDDVGDPAELAVLFVELFFKLFKLSRFLKK